MEGDTWMFGNHLILVLQTPRHTSCVWLKISYDSSYIRYCILSAFRDRGVPKPTSECCRVPQPRWVDARLSAKGGKWGGRRPAWERWKSRGLRVRPAPRSGALAVGGYKRPRGRGSERPHASACLLLVPARPTPSKRALVLPFIGVRRGSRCTMGGAAECYVSSEGELAP
jgi:hypothetical protein